MNMLEQPEIYRFITSTSIFDGHEASNTDVEVINLYISGCSSIFIIFYP
jgi:hypothetical protein